MQDPKVLKIISCRKCNGEYYGGEHILTLKPGTIDKLPDEISVIVRKIPACQGCKEQVDRTRGSKYAR